MTRPARPIHRGVLYFPSVASAVACVTKYRLGHRDMLLRRSPCGWSLMHLSGGRLGLFVGPADLARARQRIARAEELDLILRQGRPRPSRTTTDTAQRGLRA